MRDSFIKIKIKIKIKKSYRKVDEDCISDQCMPFSRSQGNVLYSTVVVFKNIYYLKIYKNNIFFKNSF